MTTDNRSSNDIERDIERDRGELARTLAELESRFTPEALFGEITRNFRRHGGDVGHAVTESVKQNPIGLALTGAGLAWLIFGRSHDERAPAGSGRSGLPRPPYPPGESYGMGDPTAAALAPEAPQAGLVPPAQRAAPGWYADPDLYDSGSGDDEREGMGERASRFAHSVGDAGRSAAGGVRDTASGARDAAQNAGRSAADRASRIRARLAQGTEDLSDEARARVLSARERAVNARHRSAHAVGRGYARGRDNAVDLFENQPLVVGALALAVGAAIASAAPRTRKEDEWFGERSDALMSEAERIFEEEKRKAGRVAHAALDEAGRIADEKTPEAREAGGAAAERAADEVRDAGRRIEQAASDEARNQKLGEPESR